MPNPNDDAAQRLIDAILPKITDALLPKLTEAVEAQIKGVVAKNDDLLAKLAGEKAQKDDLAALLAAVDAREKENVNKSALPDSLRKQTDDKGPVIISKQDALDRAKYLQAKALADKRGVAMQIAKADAPPADNDTRTHHATETHLYVTSAAMRDTPTYKRLRAQAEREHLTFQPVRTLADVEGANDAQS
jgi:hypothetical protein